MSDRQERQPLSVKVAEIQEILNDAVKDFNNTEFWEGMLKATARFHRYSVNNKILIYMQNPEATLCAGYATWKKNGYHVRRGEKGIRILAPRTATAKDRNGEVILDEKGNPETVTFFVPAYVFDISQVEAGENAKPLPQLPDYEGDSATEDRGLYEALEGFMSARGWTVELMTLDAELGGYTVHEESKICVNAARSPLGRATTLAHEVAHALLHADMNPVEYAHNLGGVRSLAETEAESVAFVVAQAWGLDATSFSIPYVSSWSEQDTKVLEAAAQGVHKAAHEILEAIMPTL